jgi:carbonic anhydrase
MKSLEEILQYNEKFVEEKKYEEYETGKFPHKKIKSRIDKVKKKK